MNFTSAAAELRRHEIARLSDALTPRIEALCAMTAPAFRAVIALMLERFGHTIIGNPEAPALVTTKAGRKFITACATPAELMPTGTRDLARLHDAVIAANAERGFFITARSFTDAAEQYAESAPLDLIDGKRLVKALNQSRKHVLLPQIYKAMWARLAGSAQNGQGTECCANERLCDRKLPEQDQSHAPCKIRLPIICKRQPSFASLFAVCSKLWPKISRPCTRAYPYQFD